MDKSQFELVTIPDEVRTESRIPMENERWLVGLPLSPRSMFWWGAFTDWCVAADHGLFADYIERGPLIIFLERQSDARWALHPKTCEFRNAKNRRASWAGFIMRHPEIAAGLLAVLPNLVQPAPPPSCGWFPSPGGEDFRACCA
ncbi:hypothetical protein [Erythrobacter dokdonensis]|uniref:hypothetical protein n=1 Tax=Erythrobacter dokdonensis TaxID=328225 RepID=UPI0018DB09BD|nr:hypothetical protein [Erythrobacter dokdonensis]